MYKKVTVPYGRKSIKFILPSDRLLRVIQPQENAHKNIASLLFAGLNKPLGTKKLSAICSGDKSVLVVVPDLTRNVHLKEMLPILLKDIGPQKRRIDIITATGLHKKHSVGQLKELVGNKVFDKARVISHEQDDRILKDLGYTKNGIPITLNKNLFTHDVIITIGVIEPHLYAGYSGGAKTVAIGLAGERTISATHSVRFLDHPGTTIGSVDGNTFQDTLRDIIKRVEPDFSINVVNGPEGGAAKIFCGKINMVFNEGVRFARTMFDIKVKGLSDIVICGVGYPKDVNLYQASRALNYILSVDNPILRKGGVLIVAAELKDGCGEGVAEKRFYEGLKGMRGSAADFVRSVKRDGCVAGGHRAYMVARALVDYEVVFVTGKAREFGALPFQCVKDIEDAIRYAGSVVGAGSKIYVVPHALSTIAHA